MIDVNRGAAGASLIALALAAGPAMAQQGSSERDVILVRGEKIERSLQDTPTSVRVFSGEDIDEANIDSVREIYRRTPNVSGGESNGNFQIRGIDVFRVSGAGTGSLASVYVDGAVLPRRAVTGGPLDVWDVSQVEILRGPQSTLQGRNALAGAVVIRSADPTWEWDGHAQTKFSEHGGREFSLAGGGPLAEDQLAFRVAATTSTSDGWVDNPFLGTDVDFRDRDMVRGKLLLEPDAAPAFSALLTLTYDDHEYGASLHDVVGPDQPRTLSFDTPTYESIITKIATLELNYELNPNWTLTSITSYNDADYDYQYDGDYTTQPLGTIWDVQDAETFTEELRASFDYGRLSGLLGAYYYEMDEEEMYGGRRSIALSSLGVETILTAPPDAGGFGLPQALADQVLALYAPADPVILDTDTNAPDTVTSYALFADFRFEVTDRLTVHGGGRYDVEEQENLFSSQITVVNGDDLPDPANFGPPVSTIVTGLNDQLYAQAAAASGATPPGETDFEAFLPKIGATWAWTEDLSTSFTVQRGYRSGGVGSNIARARVFSFAPEYTWNYDFALRSEWLDGALRANANVFYIDWTDQQIAVQLSGNNFDTEVENAGSSHLYGFEAELFYEAADGLDLFAGVGHTKSEFDEFIYDDGTGAVTDLSGRDFANAPEWTLSAGATWRGANGLFLHADANYVSEANAVVNPALYGGADPKADARTLVNAMVGYETDRFGAYLYADNLLGEDYVVRPDLADGLQVRGAPRVFGVRLDARY